MHVPEAISASLDLQSKQRHYTPNDTCPFVGIRKNKDNEMVFRLPRGFNNFPDEDFDATKKLFFKMYRTFKKFEKDNKLSKPDDKSTEKDNIERAGNGYHFKDKEDNEVVLYSKISVIENLLEAYRDLALDVIERKTGRNEEIDYSKIDKYLHKATYLDDDVIYIDEMELPRHFLNYESATLIDLFCFILYELENELEQETEERVKDLANRFKEQHLAYDQSLFEEESFDSTITALKDSLDDIDKITAYKDEDYWRLYEAIESFLYGELDMQNPHEDGVFWGINNFYQIWEDMCNTYIFSKPNEYDVIYADTNIILNKDAVSNYSDGRHNIFKKDNFDNPFFIQFRKENPRWMRPDLIHLLKSEEDFIFKSKIKVNITKTNNGRLDFNIKLLDKSKKNIYKAFCSNLQKSLHSGIMSSQRIHGARVVDGNKFKNYPEIYLVEQQGFIEKYYQKGSVNYSYIILDWKYMDKSNFFLKNKKLESDITKQLCYEFSIEKSLKTDMDMESQFVIPFFYHKKLKPEDEIGCFIEDSELYNRLQKNNIRVFKANFKKIQEVYLNND